MPLFIPPISGSRRGILLLATLFGMYPFLKKLFADAGYQGPQFQKALAKILPHLEPEIVKRSDQVKGFAVLPKRRPLLQPSNIDGDTNREMTRKCEF
jgi:hypothetical protein